MNYLIDSDVLADWLAGKPEAQSTLAPLAADGFAISLITYGEIYEGILYGRDPQRAEQIFRELIRRIDVLPLNRTIVRRFSYVRGDLRRRGQTIGDLDILIGVTALHHDLVLVTGNGRHFNRISGLRLLESPE